MRLNLVTGIFLLFAGIIFFLIWWLMPGALQYHQRDVYAYDKSMPLLDTAMVSTENEKFTSFHVSFQSVNHKRVTALLSIPKGIDGPWPVLILLHGLGDRKTVDYIQAGHDFYIGQGYAVFRPDLDNHGDRQTDKFSFSLTSKTRYRSREIIRQSVVDLQRSLDYLESRENIDMQRTGFFGISLGGIIGTVFCAIDKRLKVPVIALAGGQLNLMYGSDALSNETSTFLETIDPILFVKEIHPRPLLMINAENDEVVPPITSKLLFSQAKKPKEIIWYDAKHRNIPLLEAYQEGLNWFQKHM
ncbi:MAG: acetylxylan esterase [Cyclobacteriaceae bacterium]|nr:acetylxylan esterase [Cyclobacteriaceae bacterium]